MRRVTVNAQKLIKLRVLHSYSNILITLVFMIISTNKILNSILFGYFLLIQSLFLLGNSIGSNN